MFRDTSTKIAKRRALARWLAFALVLVAATLGAYTLGRSQSPAGISPQDEESVALYAEALDVVRDDYVDQKAVDSKKETYGAIEGMLDSLGDDGHTRFLTPEEVKQNRQGLSGKYVGIGVTLETEGDRVLVSSPIEGSPAEEAGIQAGDVLVAVNGKSVRGEDVAQIAERVRGPEGSRVRITVLRDEEERDFSMERAELEVPVVSWTMIPDSDVADIQLASFSDNSAEELAAAFEKARDAGARRFILDLRNNPGGRLDQAVDMSGSFLKPGSVVYIRKDSSGEREEVRVDNGAEPIEAPVVVLVNKGTASSAEIVAGALRDNGRAKVVGTTTFGTGTVLSEFTLSDGSAILLGIAEWLTPNGDFIRETGIEPDIKVELKKDSRPLSPGEIRDHTQEKIFSKDAQLERAFEVVRKE